MTETPGNPFEGVTPVLRVASLEASLRYYVDALGFTVEWQYPRFACAGRDRCHVFLCEGDQGHPGAWVWIGVHDVELLHDEYRRRGARIRNPPSNYRWAYEMQVEDLDGNVLRIGSDARNDRPPGDWLDMHGRRWGQRGMGVWEPESR